MKRVGLRAAVLGSALLVTAAPSAWGQSGNQSDITGVNTTSSAIAAFTPGGAALVAFGSLVTAQLANGTLTGVTGTPIPPAVQTMLAGLLNGTTAPPPGLATALGASAGVELGNALVAALQGLLVNPEPAGVVAAIEAFNAIVDASDQTFLSAPPQEFVAVQAALAELAQAIA